MNKTGNAPAQHGLSLVAVLLTCIALFTAPSRPVAQPVPAFCNEDPSPTENAICQRPDLLKIHAEVTALHKARLDAVRNGEERGAAVIDARNWRLTRDACGPEPVCIQYAYQLRRIALAEFSGAPLAGDTLARRIQEELNRLSCDAGPADGQPGSRTRAAYALAASLTDGLNADAPLISVETLAGLRVAPAGLCSFLRRAGTNPDLLAGTWRFEFPTCRSGTSEVSLRRVRIRAVGDGAYDGLLAYGDGAFSRDVGGTLGPNTLTLVHVTPVGARQVYEWEPGDAPDTFTGFYNSGECALVVTR